MDRPINQPRSSDFRHGSTDRLVINEIERAVHYGLVADWSRVVGVDEKPTYRLTFVGGQKKEGLKPKDAETFLDGLIIAHGLHVKGFVTSTVSR